MVEAQTIGQAQEGTILGSELQAICFAVGYTTRTHLKVRVHIPTFIFTDSKDSLRGLSYGDSNNQHRDICGKILSAIEDLKDHGLGIHLR